MVQEFNYFGVIQLFVQRYLVLGVLSVNLRLRRDYQFNSNILFGSSILSQLYLSVSPETNDDVSVVLFYELVDVLFKHRRNYK